VKKFDVEDIRDRVGGLWEIGSTIERNKFESEIVNNICKFLNFSIRQDILTKEEESKLFERGNRRLIEEQWYLYGNNDGFDIYN
jgi:lipoate-protein ligase A